MIALEKMTDSRELHWRMKYFLPIFLVAFGCSNGSNNSNNQMVQDPAPFVDVLTSAHCERIFACCEASDLDIVFVGEQVTSLEECESAVSAQLNAFFLPAINGAQERESVTLNPDEFSGCQNALSAQTCAEFSPGIPTKFQGVCDTAFEAKLETSGFCQNDFECKTNFCSLGVSAELGSCKVPPMIGAACENGRCGDGAFCDAVVDVCVVKLDVDADCNQNEQCKSGRCEIEDATGMCVEVPTFCEGA